MAWVNFQKSNWTRTLSSEHARQYFTAVAAGITVTAATTQLVTLTSAAYQFQGNGPVEISFPFGFSNTETVAAQGLLFGNAWLQATATAAYSAGNHPQIVFQVSSQTLLTVAATGFSVIAVQY
jgi:hypothetical protein